MTVLRWKPRFELKLVENRGVFGASTTPLTILEERARFIDVAAELAEVRVLNGTKLRLLSEREPGWCWPDKADTSRSCANVAWPVASSGSRSSTSQGGQRRWREPFAQRDP